VTSWPNGADPAQRSPAHSLTDRPRPRAPVFLALLTTAVSALRAVAHSPDGITQRTCLVFDPPALQVEYATTFDPLASPAHFMAADSNWDGTLSTAETEAYLQVSATSVLPKLSIWLEDRRVPLTLDHGSRVALTTRELVRSLRLRGDIGRPVDGTYLVRVSDENPPPSAIEHIAYVCEARRGARTQRVVSQDGRLEWIVLVSADLPGDATSAAPDAAVAPQPAPPPAPAMMVSPPFVATQDTDRMANFVRRTELSPGGAALALLLAAGLGMLHALSPGHGKSLMAGYLVGSRGTVGQAIALGAIVTVTHVGSVLLVGMLVLGLATRLLPEQVFPWLGFGSGVLVSGVGLWMLIRRALGASDEDHHHDRDHHHHDHHDPAHGHLDEQQPHSHHDYANLNRDPGGAGSEAVSSDVAGGRRPETVAWGGLLTIGVAGGMVPCPSALVVLLTAIAFRRIAFGLALILAFSMGLAIVLIAIGILCVKAAHLVNRSQGDRMRRLLKALPVLSAVLIALAGVAMAVNALLAGGILRFR
jgi:ABC-type nickel/cobalt efflux system permease component RcnA